MRLLPLNSRAQSILSDQMEGNPKVRVIERRGRKILVHSLNGKFCAWVQLVKDRNWDVILR